MNLCISSLAWDNKDRLSVYELLQEQGVPYLEIVLSKLSSKALNEDIEFYQQYKQEWEFFGLKAISMQSIHFGVENAKLFGTDEQRLNLLNATKKAIDIAHALEIPNIVFGSPKLRILPEEGESHSPITFFQELNDYAKPKNCFINIEANSTQYGTNFLTTTQQVEEFVYAQKWENIGINLDLSTLILEEEDITQTINDIYRVRHAHISVPFLKSDFENYKSYIEEYIVAYNNACIITPTVETLYIDSRIRGLRNMDTLSIEMVSQETDLILLDKIINLVKEYI